MDEPAEDAIEALVARFVEARERGESVDPEAFAAAHPEGGERLRATLASVERAEGLFPSGAPDTPSRIGPYRVLGELGRGGMGRVLRVEHEDGPGRPLALKLLHVALPRSMERFRREGEALRRLDQPGVVRVVDTGLAGSLPYLVMELVEGESLAARIARARTSGDRPEPTDAARLVARIARAVHAAHEAGVLHRDLNPRNVLVRPDGEPVVIDFGLGRADDAPTMTGSGDMLGTPQYMAPEQARGERVDHRADVYGLGAILYELLTLEPPRSGDETLAILRAASSRPLPPPRRIDPGLPRPLDRIVRRATAYRRDWRTPDAATLADDLQRFAAGEPVAARAPGVLERAHHAWLLHGRAIAVVAVLALLVASAMIFNREDIAPRVRELHEAVAVAWLDDDRAELTAATDAIEDLNDDDLMLDHLRALLDGRFVEASSDPGVAALAEGLRLRAAGEPAEALASLRIANNLLPNSPEILAAIAITAYEAGSLDFARSVLEAIARPLAASRTLHRTLAETYLALGLPDDAVLASTTAMKIDPDDPVSSALLARAQAAVTAASGTGSGP